MTQFQPLRGVNILDFSRLLPGPWATAVAADLGATVIKLEFGQRGDYSRFAPPYVDGRSVYFENVNRGKSGVRVDLSDPDDRAYVEDLIRTADVLVESFRPGTMDAMGFGRETVRQLNPRTVYCSMTGFGQTGDYAQSAGHDINIVGTTGFMGHGDNGAPTMPGVQLADYAGATTLVMAILGGVMDARATGQGTCLDVNMLDSLLSWGSTVYAGAIAHEAGSDDTRRVESFGGNPRYGAYQCQDGKWVTVALLETKLWRRFCEHVNLPHLINPDETEADRMTPHGEFSPRYRTALTDLFAQRPRDAWIKEMIEHNLPCFPVYDHEEVFRDPHVRSRNMLRRPNGSALPLLIGPIRVTGDSDTADVRQFIEVSRERARELFAENQAD